MHNQSISAKFAYFHLTKHRICLETIKNTSFDVIEKASSDIDKLCRPNYRRDRCCHTLSSTIRKKRKANEIWLRQIISWRWQVEFLEPICIGCLIGYWSESKGADDSIVSCRVLQAFVDTASWKENATRVAYRRYSSVLVVRNEKMTNKNWKARVDKWGPRPMPWQHQLAAIEDPKPLELLFD